MTVTNECTQKKILEVFVPVLNEATSILSEVLGEQLLSVRLLGSIPRGEPITGESDIDLVALCHESVSESKKRMLQVASDRLSATKTVTTRVDLAVEVMDQVHPFREFVFRTDSVLLWGSDQYTERTVTMTREQLAALVTPDFAELLANYREGVLSAEGAADILQYSRWIGKDYLKCFRKHLILEHGIYEKSAPKIHANLARYYPKEQRTFHVLLELYLHPTEVRDKAITGIKLAQETKERLRT